VDGMAWATRLYSKQEIDTAGDALISLRPDDPARVKPIEIINNWRACHGFPLWLVATNLAERVATITPKSFTAQRIKRLPSILVKLKNERTPTSKMRLSQMQDIGGCRAVVGGIPEVEKLVAAYNSANHPNIIIDPEKTKNYVASPKLDGYRSVHLIATHHDPPTSDQFGKKIEIQIRTVMQHAWATALEICETFTNAAFKPKVKTANPKWLRLFALMSSEIATWEGCPNVPGTVRDSAARQSEIKDIEASENVLGIMSGWTFATSLQPEISNKEPDAFLFLLKLNAKEGTLQIDTYTKDEIPRAEEDYSTKERETEGQPGMQVVLVSVESLATLREAYPNYYMDASGLIAMIRRSISY
jgi:hypothetical protein